jgi:hypothetical protein
MERLKRDHPDFSVRPFDLGHPVFLRVCLCAFVDMLQKLVGKTRFSRDFVAQASSL